MRESMHAREWWWEPPYPTARTTKIVSSEGGAARAYVVARSTWTRAEDRWRLVDSAAATTHPFSLSSIFFFNMKN